MGQGKVEEMSIRLAAHGIEEKAEELCVYFGYNLRVFHLQFDHML